MTTTGKPVRRRPRGLPASYVGMWLLLLSLSILYLTGVALKPELMAEILPPVRVVQPESNEGQRSAARAVAEADALRQDLEQSRAELAALRTELASRTASEQSATGEARATQPVEKLDPAPPAPAAAASKPAAPQRSTDRTKAARQAALAEPKPEVKPAQAAAAYLQPGRILNGQPAVEPAQVTTGSIGSPATVAAAAPPPPQFGPATVKPARPEPSVPQGVQLASGPSLDALRLSWVLLTERHGASLKGLQPRYVTGNETGGKAYDLIAGPIASAEDAERVCAALRAKKVACAVSPFSGNAL